MNEELTSFVCPFCAEDDFDSIGLVAHLDQWCDKASATRDAWREDEMRRHNAAVLARQARQNEEREEQEREEMRLDLRAEEDRTEDTPNPPCSLGGHPND